MQVSDNVLDVISDSEVQIVSNLDALEHAKHIISQSLVSLELGNVLVVFDPDLVCGKGHITTSDEVENIHQVVNITIGIKGFSPIGLDTTKMFLLFKTMYHELRHVYQESVIHSECTDEFAYYMDLAYVCRMMSLEYYRQPWNYRHNIKELDAEYNALQNMRLLFDSIWGIRIADCEILEFINYHKCLHERNPLHGYYIDLDTSYRAVKDVFAAFEREIQQAPYVMRHFPFWKDNQAYDELFALRDGKLQDEWLVRKFFNENPSVAAILRKNTPGLQFFC